MAFVTFSSKMIQSEADSLLYDLKFESIEH